MSDAAIVWFRRDLRLADNPALNTAAQRHGQVIPVFIDDRNAERPWAPGSACRVWLHHSLAALQRSLQALDSELVIRRGDSATVLAALAAETGAAAVYWNRLYEPQAIARDRRIKQALREASLHAQSFNAALLAEPWEVATGDASPYRVFSPFWRNLGKRDMAAPLATPQSLPPLPAGTAGSPLAELALTPDTAWDTGIREAWQPGEQGAMARLRQFMETALERYGEDRDRPDLPGSSRLSPHLHFGEIGPRQVWRAISDARASLPAAGAKSATSYLRELGWREFGHHILYHFPHTPEQPLNPRFEAFPWDAEYAGALAAWRCGQTGIPLIDAAMRELWHSGWMHNRVRMVVASWLTKNLLIPWQEGARWFWDTLVDADLANNTLGWQWASGCGADAAPYFRVFNPLRQSQRFDPDGTYIRRWVPELAGLTVPHVHAPWQAPANVLAAAGVRIGRDYPAQPQADLQESRRRALAAYERIKSDNY